MVDFKDKITFGEPILDRFFNGYSPLETVLVKFANKIGFVTVSDLFTLITKASVPNATERMLSKAEDIWIKDVLDEVYVYGEGGFSRVVKIVRRRIYEDIFSVKTTTKKTDVSKSHKFVVKEELEEKLKSAFELKEGDKLRVYDKEQEVFEPVVHVEVIKPSFLHVYGILTENFNAYVSGILGKSY